MRRLAFKTQRITTIFVLVCIFLTLFSTIPKTEAAPNYQMNYQGKLLNASNVAVADGTYNMRFWILTSTSIATTSALWTESLTGTSKVQVTNGLFSVMLGSTTPLTGVDFNQPLYLGVEIGGTSTPAWDGEMSPRKILGTVPSAFEAKNTQTFAGIATTSFLRSDQADSASSLLTFTGGIISNSSSTITNLTSLIATTTTLVINNSPFTSLTGTGLSNSAGVLTCATASGSATGCLTNTDWTSFNGKVSSTSIDTSAELAALITDETGTAGNLVFSTNPLLAGFRSSASSTIGDGTGAGGLTINGTATTTNLKITALTDGCLSTVSGLVTSSGVACGAGGGGGAGTWATTTQGARVVNYSLNNTDIVSIGGNSTTTAKYWFDPSNKNAYLTGGVGIGTTTPTSLLTMGTSSVSGSQVAGIKQYFGFTNSVLNAVYYGDETYINNAPTATSTLVGKMIRIADSTSLSNVVRGLEVQAQKGTNTKGENTGINSYGRTFGIKGTTEGDAGELARPAGVFAETRGTTQGNALRAYTGTLTTEDLVSLYQDTSTFAGTMFAIDAGNSGGSFSATSSRFVDFKKGGVSQFTVMHDGSLGIGTTTPSRKLTIQGGDAWIGGNLTATGTATFANYTATNGTTTNATTTNLKIATLRDNAGSTGSNGMVLQTNGSVSTWVATSSLGFGTGNGTVTSVGLSAPTGFSVSGSPVTTSGTLTLSYTAGYEGLLSASSTNWNTFYNTPSNRITAGTGLSWSTNTLNCATASGSTQGCLSTTDWNIFNNKLASTSIDTSSELATILTDETGTAGNLVFSGNPLLAGFRSSASSTIGDGTGAGGLTINGTATTTNLKITALTDGCLSTVSGLVTSSGVACGAGGGGGAGTWATTTQGARVVNYSLNNTDIVSIGGNSTTTAKYWFDPSNQVAYLAGKVGIGTTTPSSLLSISNSINTPANTALLTIASTTGGTATTTLFQVTASGNVGMTNGGVSDLEFTLDNGTAKGIFEVQTNNVVRLGTFTNHSFEFITNNITRLKVTNSGNVGIGSTSPSSLLTVGGDGWFGGNLTATGTATFANLLTTGSSTIGGGTGATGLTISGGATTTLNQYIGGNLTVLDRVTFDDTDFNTKLGYQTGKNIVAGAQYNTFSGYQAGFSSSTASTNGADYNSGYGYQSLYSNTTGYANSAMGVSALLSNTTGTVNSAVGYQSLYSNTTGYENSAVGASALNSNTTGYQNSAVGRSSLLSNNTGYSNSAVGYASLYNNETGYNNSAVGVLSLLGNTKGSNNSALGYRAGYNLGNTATSSGNIFLGYQAGYNQTQGDNNIALGYNVDLASTTGSNQLTIGNLIYGTGINGTGATTSTGNIGIGTTTPAYKLTVAGNGWFDGNLTVLDRVTFDDTDFNTKLGYQTGKNIVVGAQYNTFSGYQAGFSSSTASTNSADYNSAYGYQSLYSNTDGYENTANGAYALRFNTTGWDNSAVGVNALYSNTTGNYNSALGYNVLSSNTIGYNNSAMGQQALRFNTTGWDNSAVGVNALYSNTTGYQNSAVGANALFSNTTGVQNVALGNNAGRYYGSGSSNNTVSTSSIFLGYDTRASASGNTNEIVIGASAIGNGSNSVTLGSTTITKTILQGNIGIGTTTPSSLLTVAGNTNITGNLTVLDRVTFDDTDFNTKIGYQTGKNIVAGAQYNTFSGYQAGFSSSTASTNGADFNSAFGYQSLYSNTSGYKNSAVGMNALYSNTTGFYNSAMGESALRYSTTGYQNSAVGMQSLYSNTTGYQNSTVGMQSLYYNTTGYQNSAVGMNAGVYLADGTTANSESNNSLFLGYSTRASVATGTNEIVIGASAIGNGSNSVTLGNTSITKTILQGNVGIGTTTPAYKLTVAGNGWFDGNLTVLDRVTFDDTDFNTKLGYQTGKNIVVGAQGNTFSGYQAGYSSSTASTNAADYNTGIGYQTLYSNTTGPYNSAVGSYSLLSNTTGSFNSAMGAEALRFNTTGTYNSAVGVQALSNTTTGYNNSAVGMQALRFNTTGSYNSAVGSYSLLSNTTGTYNSAMGQNALYYNTTGYQNSAVGMSAGQYLADGSTANQASNNSLFLGYDTRASVATGTNEIVIGASAIGNGSNSVTLGSTTITKTILQGNVGIGTTTPSSLLSLHKTGLTGGVIGGIREYLNFTNNTASAINYGDNAYLVYAPTATSTLVGKIIRVEDSTVLGNVVRGLEVQAHRGTNTKGENTGITGFGRTFGVWGTTIGDAGDTYLPAGVFAETQGTTQGNALRAYSGTITTEKLVSLFQDTSVFSGTGLQMNFGNAGGSFAATSSAKFLDFQVAGTSRFTVTAGGTTTIGDGTTNNKAGLQIGYGGLCVDNDGSCFASTTGKITSVTSATGNSDLAEMYFSSQSLHAGEIVSLAGGLSVVRASGTSTQKEIIGVVSTKPGLLLGFDDVSLIAGETGYPVGLKGRVPIKLSTENGPIKKGDRIALSSIPGVGMKATENTRVVGIALEDFDGDHAYSTGFLNQFGDDMVNAVRTPREQNTDIRTQDGCYYGAGVASGEKPCAPEKAMSFPKQTVTTPTTTREETLNELAQTNALSTNTPHGVEVRVGQALMFIELGWHQNASTTEMLSDLLATSTVNNGNGTETLWDRIKTLAQNFVDGVLTLTGIKADRVEVKNELCIDGVCVTADDLRVLLNNAGRDGNAQSQTNDTLPSAPSGETSSVSGSGTDSGSTTIVTSGVVDTGGEVVPLDTTPVDTTIASEPPPTDPVPEITTDPVPTESTTSEQAQSPAPAP